MGKKKKARKSPKDEKKDSQNSPEDKRKDSPTAVEQVGSSHSGICRSRVSGFEERRARLLRSRLMRCKGFRV